MSVPLLHHVMVRVKHTARAAWHRNNPRSAMLFDCCDPRRCTCAVAVATVQRSRPAVELDTHGFALSDAQSTYTTLNSQLWRKTHAIALCRRRQVRIIQTAGVFPPYLMDCFACSSGIVMHKWIVAKLSCHMQVDLCPPGSTCRMLVVTSSNTTATPIQHRLGSCKIRERLNTSQ